MYDTAYNQIVKMYSMEDKNVFVKWLLDEMAARDLNQSQLARKAGISRGAVNGIINGTRGVGTDVARAIAHAFQMPPAEVFRIAGYLPGTTISVEKQEALLHYFSQLNTTQQQGLIDYAEFLLRKG